MKSKIRYLIRNLFLLRGLSTSIVILLTSLTFSTSQIGHWEKLNPPNNPGYRADHGMAPIGYKKVLLFGGSNGFILGDTWIYDFEKNDWSEIECKNSPSNRVGMGICNISEKEVLLFGGSDDGGVATFNDLWLFNLDSLNWIKLDPKPWNNKYYPLPLFSFGMAKLSNNSVVIYGGEILDGNPLKGYSDETWIYYIEENQWEYRNIGWPESRASLMMTELDSNLVLMCGGYKHGLFNDSWYLENDNYFWFRFKNLLNDMPLVSASAISGLNNRLAVLFGGVPAIGSGKSWYDSTWIFDYYNKTWLKLELDQHPSDRASPGIARIDINKAILFGGSSKTNPKPYDTWLFVLDSVPTSVCASSLNEKSFSSIYANGVLKISTDEKSGILSVFNILGRRLYTSEISGNETYIEITEKQLFLIVFDTGAKKYYRKVLAY